MLFWKTIINFKPQTLNLDEYLGHIKKSTKNRD